MKKSIILLIFSFAQLTLFPQTITRGPYLQQGNQNSVIVRWRTDIATSTRVQYGTVAGSLSSAVSNASLTTEHEIAVTGLLPDTKYFYNTGTVSSVLQETDQHFFVTVPPGNTSRMLRFIAFGDCGNNSVNQVNVRKAMKTFLAGNNPDAWILMGDNAYSFGADAEYQSNFFDIYKDTMLKNIKLYPAPGNHDYGNTQANAALRNLPYYQNFTLPAAGECGGMASGTEAYYSFDIGNVHLVALDSYGKEDGNTTRLYDTLGSQVSWLKNDLAANTKPWTVVYFHHPPFTKGSHNSDVTSGADLELRYMRENFIRILERYGVDLVLCGHSHSYERTFIQKNFYETADLYNSSYQVSSSSGKYDNSLNSCPYYSTAQKNMHGTVYVLSGSSGQLGGTSPGYPHNAMYYSTESIGGAFYFEVQENRLNAKFVCSDNVIRDQFTIEKDVNKKLTLNVLNGTPVNLTASYLGTYHWVGTAGSTRTVTVTPPPFAGTTYMVNDNINCVADTFIVNTVAVLPLILERFTVSEQNSFPNLEWKVFAGNECRYFILEKSMDGRSFSYVNKTTAMAGTNNYQVIDQHNYGSPVYYRLTAITIDGHSKILGNIIYRPSKPAAFAFTTGVSANEVTLYVSSAQKENISIALFTRDGKKLLGQQEVIPAGTSSIKINVQPGLYFIRCSNGQSSITRAVYF